MTNSTLFENFVTIAGLLAGFSLTIVAMLYSDTNKETGWKNTVKLISEILLLLSTVLLITSCISGSILLSLPNYKDNSLMERPVDTTLTALKVGFALFYLGTILLSFRKIILIGVVVTVVSVLSILWLYRLYVWLPSQLEPITTRLFLDVL